jgi:hypothetical protein
MPVAAIGRAGAHVSPSGSAAKIRLRAGAEDQRDTPCALNQVKLEEFEDRNRIGEVGSLRHKRATGDKIFDMVRNVTKRDVAYFD